MKKKAFTLIELMVVIAIIGILLAVVAPQVFRQINKGKTAACEQFYAAVKTGATSFYSDNMSWPVDTNGFLATTGATTWDGPYLDRWQSLNPWGGGCLWYNRNGTDFGASLALERFIAIGYVPYADAVRIDTHIDGTASGTSGWVRYSPQYSGASVYTVIMLVSRDGPVD